MKVGTDFFVPPPGAKGSVGRVIKGSTEYDPQPNPVPPLDSPKVSIANMSIAGGVLPVHDTPSPGPVIPTPLHSKILNPKPYMPKP